MRPFFRRVHAEKTRQNDRRLARVPTLGVSLFAELIVAEYLSPSVRLGKECTEFFWAFAGYL